MHSLGAYVKKWRDRVGELNDADCTNDADQRVEVGNNGADHECDGCIDELAKSTFLTKTQERNCVLGGTNPSRVES